MRLLTGLMTVLRRIVDLSLVALVGVVLFGLFLGKVVPLTGHQIIIIGGGSMQPSIGLGAAVVIGPVAAGDLAKGDVVSLQVGPSQTTFTHRIVEVVTRSDGVWVRTRGDANNDLDPTLVPATSILGRVEWTIPFAGYLLALLALPAGVLFVLGLAATLIAAAWLLESLASDTVRDVRVASDPGRGEPIAARQPLSRTPGLAPLTAPRPSAATAAATMSSYRELARPSVPQQLTRSRNDRVRHNRWLASHQGRRSKAD